MKSTNYFFDGIKKSKGSDQRFSFGRPIQIFLGDAACVVGCKLNGDMVEGVGPFRMVTTRLGIKCHAGHKSKGRDEVRKLILAMEFVAPMLPMRQALQAS